MSENPIDDPSLYALQIVAGVFIGVLSGKFVHSQWTWEEDNLALYIVFGIVLGVANAARISFGYRLTSYTWGEIVLALPCLLLLAQLSRKAWEVAGEHLVEKCKEGLAYWRRRRVPPEAQPPPESEAVTG
jgi:hypothetical protein